MSWKVHNPREPERPEQPESWWESWVEWWFCEAWPAIKRFLRGGDDGPKGPRAA